MKGLSSRLVTGVESIASIVVKLTQAPLLILLVVLVVSNYGSLEKCLQRTGKIGRGEVAGKSRESAMEMVTSRPWEQGAPGGGDARCYREASGHHL